MSLSSRSPNNNNTYNSLINGDFELALTSEIFLEYEEIINEMFGNQTSNYYSNLLSLLPNVRSTISYYTYNLIQVDPDENKYADCAINSIADFLVTRDPHFDIQKGTRFPYI